MTSEMFGGTEIRNVPARELDGYDLSSMGEVLSINHRKVELRVPKNQAAAVTSRLLTDLPVLDLTIEDPPIEDVIATVFKQPRTHPPASDDSTSPDHRSAST